MSELLLLPLQEDGGLGSSFGKVSLETVPGSQYHISGNSIDA